MKTNYKPYLNTILFLIFSCIACSKHNEKEINCNGITIIEDRISSPQWLVEKIDSINNLSALGNREPWVYSIKHNNQEYLLLFDSFHSILVNAHIFCTCFGHIVNWESENALWLDLFRLFNEGNRTLLWRKSI